VPIYLARRAVLYRHIFFLSVSLWLYSPLDFGRFFSFLILYTVVGLLVRGISPSQGRYLHMTTQTQNKRTQTSMPRMGFEPTTPVFERACMVHALDRATTVIGCRRVYQTVRLWQVPPKRRCVSNWSSTLEAAAQLQEIVRTVRTRWHRLLSNRFK
jgi:hypothetical protein